MLDFAQKGKFARSVLETENRSQYRAPFSVDFTQRYQLSAKPSVPRDEFRAFCFRALCDPNSSAR